MFKKYFNMSVLIIYFLLFFLQTLSMNFFQHKNPETVQESGENAQRRILNGCDLVKEILSTVIGPSGALKMLINDKYDSQIVTNDGATILKNVEIDHPIAKILIDTSINQDKEEGDGTTSIALLASILVQEASKLNIHRVNIIKGYQLALQKCLEVLNKAKFEGSLHGLAKTTLSSKVLRVDLDHFADICVDAIKGISDLEHINIIKCSGRLEDSFYVSDGFILESSAEIPIPIDNPKILIANTAMDFDKIKIFGAKVDVSSVKELTEIERAERERMKEKIDKICFNHDLEKKVPFIDVFINRQIMYDLPKERFKINGVTPIEHVNFEGVERLAGLVNGTILSSFYEKINDSNIGSCKRIENITIGDKRMIKLSGTHKSAGTIVLFGSSKDVLEEAERSIHDALCVLRNKEIICGGGYIESLLYNTLIDYAKEIPSSISSSIISFADSLLELIRIIANNCKMNGEEVKAELRSKNKTISVDCFGIDFAEKKVGNMKTLEIFESFNVKRRVLCGACEAAQIIIKCDGVIQQKPRERSRV